MHWFTFSVSQKKTLNIELINKVQNIMKLDLTQIEMSSGSVTVQFGFQYVIFTVHLDSLRVEGHGVTSLFSPVFFVTFFQVDCGYRLKTKRLFSI